MIFKLDNKKPYRVWYGQLEDDWIDVDPPNERLVRMSITQEDNGQYVVFIEGRKRWMLKGSGPSDLTLAQLWDIG